LTQKLDEDLLVGQIVTISPFAILILLWIPFDYLVDPLHFETFLVLRFICALVIFGGRVAFIRTGKQAVHYRKFALLIYLSLMLTILPMCIMTSEKYPYYVGFSTLFFGASVLFIWPLRYFLIPMLLSGLLVGIAEWNAVTDPKIAATGIFLMVNVCALSGLASWLTYQGYLRNGALLNQLENLSNTDRLTGIANRRYFDHKLQNELTRASRNGSTTAVLLLDIDYFKNYNDHYGHQQGDECLRRVSDCLRKAISREPDFVARYGGEEFVVVLPNSDVSGAESVVKRIIDGLSELRIPHAQSSVAPFVTVSIGVACRKATSAQDMVALADSALYKAKQGGRNSFVVA
jgi:diguanylate cyclase (GGDEF)-like protein